MKAKLILNNKEYEVEVSEVSKEQVKEIEKPKCKRWRAKTGCRYWFMLSYGEVIETTEYYTPEDNFLFSTGNYFKNEEEADEYKKKLMYRQQYKDYIGEDIVTKENWGDIITPKYYAVFNIDTNSIIIERDASYNITQGTIYSKSFSKIEKFIDKVGEDNFKKYILKIED